MKGADKAKYGTVMKGLVSQFSMKNDQYPKTIIDAMDIMAKHPFDEEYYEKKRNTREKYKQQHDEPDNEQQHNQTNGNKDYRCYVCRDKIIRSVTAQRKVAVRDRNGS